VNVDSRETQLIGVREAARRLGVHENTVRNWAKTGRLPTARVPGTTTHRFDVRDVERLVEQRGRPVVSVEDERRTIGPELVDATQLSQWAASRDAQEGFPELMRRLLAATPGITNVSIRAGDGVAAPGWDGRARSTGTAFLPAGDLRLEFGVSANPKGKADDDFEKRRDHPSGYVPKDVTFVFATPRRWAGGPAWADARRAEEVFAGVQVLDADDLEGWLQATPAVHVWISERLGRKPRDARTLAHWWQRFRARTDPALPAELFLAGRSAHRERLLDILQGPAAATTVQAPWRDEAIAFIAASLKAGDVEGEPALMISSSDVWDRVVVQPGKSILVPVFDDPDIGSALGAGHHVILPIGGDALVHGTRIELSRPDRQAAMDALEAAGLRDQAYELSALARRSMPSLIRRLARDPRFARPLWSEPPSAEVLAPLLLAGAFTDSEADRGIAGRIAGKSWPDVERTLLAWATKDDPPFVRSGTQWQLAAPEEGLLVLSGALTSADLQRWHEIVITVLLETNPSLDPALDERPMAGVLGAVRVYSDELRRGLAQGVALIATLGDARLADRETARDHARQIVREILRGAEGDRTGATWQSLEDVLPLLAEAAPDDFLDAIHDDLDSGKPLLEGMFQDRGRGAALFGSSPHTGLLWALETLCWSPEYLANAIAALARLAAIDPGGRLANRPIRSLGSVLVGWIRHTSASIEQKLDAIAVICRTEPDVGWQLVTVLWPSRHATSFPPASPKLHDWKPESRQVPADERLLLIEQLVGHAIALAGTDSERWSQMLRMLGPLPPGERHRVLDAFERVADDAGLEDERRLELWEPLQKEIARHRRFSKAEWSMGADPLERMQAIADSIEPERGAERHAYLFGWRPDLEGIDLNDHAAYDKRLQELRIAAVNETLDGGGIAALGILADRSPVPGQLGWILGAVAQEDLTADLLLWLDADASERRQAAAAWAQRRMLERGAGWLRSALAHPNTTTEAQRDALILNAPATAETWDALVALDPALADLYWRSMHALRVDAADAERASRELLAHGRPWAAVDLLAAHVREDETPPATITSALVDDVLDAALRSDREEEAQIETLGYEIGLLLDCLERSGADSDRLAFFEFNFFRLLDDVRTPRALFSVLATDPRQFVALVELVYRGKHEPKRQLSEHEQLAAHHAWWILANWDQTFPGKTPDGTIDAGALRSWVREARDAFAETGREDIGDEQIGQVLARSPVGTDGTWPAEPVRELLEEIGSVSIESGVHVGVYNARGVTTRGVFDGGGLERDLAARYREWERATAGRWRRTNRVLRELAEGFERDARREDDRASVTGDGA
jgi:excisionase family DNA binding protein